jgi:anti-sigma factor RsiW
VEDLSCQELVELVTDYFDGALPPGDRARFEAHLDECAGCARYVEQMRTTVAVTGATAGLEDRPEVAGLLDAFRGWHRAR